MPHDKLGFPDKDCEMLHYSRVLQELKGHYLSIGEFHYFDPIIILQSYCEVIQSSSQLSLVRKTQGRRYELVRKHEPTKVT